ncbi:MAG: M20/M25/M40 family metallo-hydrolase [Oscillospiraceae bacterium]|jgi:carboxypeptidase PM20D1|nr:M20/M25/M40 family metallo-hydrolase [Oscillospiraceae bacterium]
MSAIAEKETVRDAAYYATGLAKLIQCPTVVTEPFERFTQYHEVLRSVFPLTFRTLEITTIGASEDDGDLFMEMAKRVGGISDPRFQSGNPRGGNALIMRWKGKSNERPVALMGHQDVAPVDEENWTYPPFAAQIHDGKLYGRGAIDCKNTGYLSLQAIEELLEEGFAPAQDVYYLSSDNEEIGGQGTPSIVRELERRGVRFSFTLDEGGAVITDLIPGAKPVAAVAVLEKGSSVWRFSAKTRGGHTSMPPKGTPWERLAAIISDIHKNKYFKAKVTPETLAMVKGFGDALNGPSGFLLKHASIFKPLIAKIAPKISPTVNALFASVVTFTMAQGSLLPNVIPNEAFIIANLRHATHANLARARRIFEKLAKKHDVECELVVGWDASPPVPVTNPEYQYIAKTIESTIPDAAVVPFIEMGATDSRHMPQLTDCALRFTPFRLTQEQMRRMHGDDENIDIDTLPEGVAFFKKLIRNWK